MIIVGFTGAGKSTLAQKVAEAAQSEEDVHVVSAGGWVRAATRIYEHGPDARRELEAATRRILDEDPEAGRRWLRGQIKTCRPVIVEGLRFYGDFYTVTRNATRPSFVVELHVPGLTGSVREVDGIARIVNSVKREDRMYVERDPETGAYCDQPNLVADLAERLLTLWSSADIL